MSEFEQTPVSEYTTYYFQNLRTKEYIVEVNGVHRIEFTPHHVCFYDERGILIHSELARFVVDLIQEVAA